MNHRIYFSHLSKDLFLQGLRPAVWQPYSQDLLFVQQNKQQEMYIVIDNCIPLVITFLYQTKNKVYFVKVGIY